MKTIEEIYAPFGRQVIEKVRCSATSSGDISTLLVRLQLPPSGSLTAQHETLKAFIFQYGVAFFLEMVDSKLTPEEVEAAKAQMLLRRLSGDTRSHACPKRLSQSGSENDVTSLRGGSQIPVAQTQQTSSPLREPNAKKIIVTDTYVGPDRRSGRDRRKSTYDRRMRVDLILRNKRYGGRDRRKTKRREEDCAKS